MSLDATVRDGRVVGEATYHAHALAHDKDNGLLVDGARVGEEEEGEGEVEEGDGGDDGLGGDERHGGQILSLSLSISLFFFSLSLSRTVYIYDSWTGEVERRAGSESCRWGGFFVVSRV